MTAGAGAAGAGTWSRQGLRVLDEALRLLDVVQATATAPAATAEAGHAGAECRVCPVCRGLAALREMNPEAMTRLGRAFGDLVAAAGDVIGDVMGDIVGSPPDAAPPAEPPPEPRPPVRLQRIDVTD